MYKDHDLYQINDIYKALLWGSHNKKIVPQRSFLKQYGYFF